MVAIRCFQIHHEEPAPMAHGHQHSGGGPCAECERAAKEQSDLGANLLPFIDRDRVRALNERERGSAKRIIKPWDQRWVEAHDQVRLAECGVPGWPISVALRSVSCPMRTTRICLSSYPSRVRSRSRASPSSAAAGRRRPTTSKCALVAARSLAVADVRPADTPCAAG